MLIEGRGSDPTHHIHVTEKGDPKFVGYMRAGNAIEAAKWTETARALGGWHVNPAGALKLDARVLELEREFEAKTATMSWRLTAPLRALNQFRRGLAERQDADVASGR